MSEIKTYWMPTDNGKGLRGGIRVVDAAMYDKLMADYENLRQAALDAPVQQQEPTCYADKPLLDFITREKFGSTFVSAKPAYQNSVPLYLHPAPADALVEALEEIAETPLWSEEAETLRNIAKAALAAARDSK